MSDFNNSGNLGLAVTEFQNSIAIAFLGNGNGSFTTPSTDVAIPWASSTSLVSADFNGDGNLDLAAGNDINGPALVISLGYGDAAFNTVSGSPFGVSSSVNSIAVGDFLGSGKLGLAVANFTDNTVTMLAGNGDGTFTQPAGSPVAVGKGPHSITVADFNGSGRLGFATANLSDGSVSIFLQH